MLPILYQDDALVAVYKPPGLLVHRSLIDKRETRFAMQIVRDQIGQHVYPVHRLDRSTSGVLLFTLSGKLATVVGEQFAAQRVKKRYYALVRGHPDERGRVDYPLKEKLDKIADKKARKDKPAQDAWTLYHRLKTFELPHAVGRYSSARYALVKLTPLTGRKHQLRRHMAHISYPILGDTTHGDGKHNQFIRQQFGFIGLALTCNALTLQHPTSGKTLQVQADFDERMVKLLFAWGLDRSQIRLCLND